MAQVAPPVGGLRSSLYDSLQPGDVELYFTEERIGLVSSSPSLSLSLAPSHLSRADSLPLPVSHRVVCVSTLGADGDRQGRKRVGSSGRPLRVRRGLRRCPW